MIFTGVTGGEIISLLYPLFILSPFCYIIISKESLDGPAYQYSGDGAVLPFKKNRAGERRGRTCLFVCDASIWNAYRRKRVCYESSVYVCFKCRSKSSGTNL